jgi:hypothetical protein
MRIRSRRTRSAEGCAVLPLPTAITTFPLRKWPLASFFARAMFDLAEYGCSGFVPIDPGNPGGSMCVHGEPVYSRASASWSVRSSAQLTARRSDAFCLKTPRVLLKRSQPTHGCGFDQKRVLLTPYFRTMPAISPSAAPNSTAS